MTNYIRIAFKNLPDQKVSGFIHIGGLAVGTTPGQSAERQPCPLQRYFASF
ncbi:hypothetical protein [Dyadobacter endophyticus]|uniref:hypothetical protein n=1 Tax=Dyadobacter endophyticus TaxID=1749036 RepID=UPI00166A3CD3|nr:hypothetical protein [Dyadobacter endophyticus]